MQPLRYTQEQCIENIHHEYWFVRREIALNIEPSYLPQMINDTENFIRVIIAQRIDSSYLPQMMNDEDWQVRTEVAQRIDKKNALLMSVIDEDKWIREIAWKNAMGLL
jgi:hypothetical protein